MHEIELIKILSFGLLIALVLGYFTQKLKLSPIVGYLFAGFIVGPHFPGYTADLAIAGQLAEAGVILLMFGVGLHFNLKELIAVRNIAVTGAIVQSVVATVVGTVVSMAFGLSLITGLVIGMGLAVASTVVLMKMLEDHGLMDTHQGHIVVGWLIVEDILTVVALVVLPTFTVDASSNLEVISTIGIAIGKVVLFAILTLLIGRKIVPWILTNVAKTRSRELFTLTILATAFSVATVASIYFGISFALGAFLAGMVVGNTSVNHQATADILPMRDAFSVIFFISVGMLVDPVFIYENVGFVLACLVIVLIIKPLSAFLIVIGLGYSVPIALTAAIGLAQIGEFSFILAQQAKGLGIIGQEGYSVLIACSIISIVLNPLLFKISPDFEKLLSKNKKVWKFLNNRAISKNRKITQEAILSTSKVESEAIIIGFGPVGRSVYDMLRMKGINSIIIELNLQTISELTDNSIQCIYGDASKRDILIYAGILKAKDIFITIPDETSTINIVSEIMKVNKNIRIYARLRFKGSFDILKGMGVHEVLVDEEVMAANMVSLLEKSEREE